MNEAIKLFSPFFQPAECFTQEWGEDDSTGELQRPYICNVCGYSTVKKYNINRHVLTHTGEKPFSCPHCSFRTARKINVHKHLLRAHREKLLKPRM